MKGAKPKLGVFKFASCDGCQLSLLDAEDHLLEVAGAVEIAHFLEASSHIDPGPYDVALVEGSITTPHDKQRIHDIRASSGYLITIGACATSGGIQALKNWANSDDFIRAVYASPEYISTLSTSTSIADHVHVDFELRGCPINQYQLIEVIAALIHGQTPRVPRHAVCLDCKRRGTVCIAVAQGVPCLGPITHTGCGAICPAYDRGCYACYGPSFQSNAGSLADYYHSHGSSAESLIPLLRNFNSAAPEFQTQSNRLEQLVHANTSTESQNQ